MYDIEVQLYDGTQFFRMCPDKETVRRWAKAAVSSSGTWYIHVWLDDGVEWYWWRSLGWGSNIWREWEKK